MGRARGVVMVSLVALALAGCGGDGDGNGKVEVLAQIELEGIPADVEAADEAVWVADTDDDGGLRKLDPNSLEEDALLPVPEGADAVGIGENTVWALSRTDGDLIPFDRETEVEGPRIDIGQGAADPIYGDAFEDLAASGDVAYANGSLGLRRATVEGEVLDPAGAVSSEDLGIGSELEFSETPVVAAEDAVWAVTENGLTRFDPETLEPLDENGEMAEALAVGDAEVWSLSDDGEISRHPTEGESEDVASLEDRFGDENPEAIAYSDGVLWLVGAGQVLRVDPETGEEIGETLALPEGTDELGYSMSAGAPDDSVVVIHRPTGMIWRVG